MINIKEFENRLLNKSIIVGISYVDEEGQLLDTHQFSGVVRKYNDGMIIIAVDNSDDEFSLPPDEDSYIEAPPGVYKIKSTGHEISNPDLMSTWTVTVSKS